MAFHFNPSQFSLKAHKFIDSMVDGPGRFFTTQAHDFMYVTLDERSYRP
jgi:hypothetical protein